MLLQKNNLLVAFLVSFSFIYVTYPILTGFLIIFNLYFISVGIIKKNSLFLVIFLSFNISLLNLIKFPQSDLINYIARYMENGELPFGQLILIVKSDFVFHYINKLIYIVTDGSVTIFIFFWSFIIYFLISLSISKLLLHNKIDKTSFVFALIFLFYTTSFLSISAHLIRQTVAGSIFVYFLTELYCGNKKFYLLPFMVFTHFSSIILLIPLVIKNKYFYIFLTLLTLYIVVTQQNIFSLIFKTIPVFNNDYISFLFSHINGAINRNNDDGDVSKLLYFISISLLIFSFFKLFKKKESEFYILLLPFYFSFLLVNLFSPIQLLWLRYSFYQHPFYFIIFPLLFTYFVEKSKLIILIYWIFSFLYFIKFYIYFSTNNWSNSYYLTNETMMSLHEYLKLL